jgi:Tol biopolymer transport system component
LNLVTKERREYPILGKNAVAYVRLSPDGTKIAYINAEGKLCAENFPIYILDLKSGLNERLDVGGFNLGWSPDGTKLVFMEYMPELQYHYSRHLVIYDLKKHKVLDTFYNEDINNVSATPYWVTLNMAH